jgi:hypothetical protein
MPYVPYGTEGPAAPSGDTRGRQHSPSVAVWCDRRPQVKRHAGESGALLPSVLVTSTDGKAHYTVEDLCQRGRLHGRFVNDAWEISTAAVERFLHTRQRMSQRPVPRTQAVQALRLA